MHTQNRRVCVRMRCANNTIQLWHTQTYRSRLHFTQVKTCLFSVCCHYYYYVTAYRADVHPNHTQDPLPLRVCASVTPGVHLCFCAACCCTFWGAGADYKVLQKRDLPLSANAIGLNVTPAKASACCDLIIFYDQRAAHKTLGSRINTSAV